MKTLILQLLFIYFVMNGCNSNRNTNNKDHRGSNIVSNYNLVGNWCLATSLLRQLNYPTINFRKDSLAVLSSRMDTVYGYKYYLQGNSIYFELANGSIREFKVIKMTQDSIIFKNLFENTTEQIYYRCDVTE